MTTCAHCKKAPATVRAFFHRRKNLNHLLPHVVKRGGRRLSLCEDCRLWPHRAADAVLANRGRGLCFRIFGGYNRFAAGGRRWFNRGGRSRRKRGKSL